MMGRSVMFGSAAASLTLAAALSAVVSTTGAPQESRGLQPPIAFQGIADEAERSRMLFEEAGKVLTHPRCVNCHPAGDRPLQGNDSHPHVPHVRRGDGGMGVAGLRCSTCHQAENVDHASLPGHPLWHLAPIEMAWHGRSLAEICAQLKDPERNGGKTLAELQHHMAEDSLVGWGWQPGTGREPAPGDQATFGELIAAWIDTGAQCPDA
jgi:hypothetical protein